jgi:hypothetical protein
VIVGLWPAILLSPFLSTRHLTRSYPIATERTAPSKPGKDSNDCTDASHESAQPQPQRHPPAKTATALVGQRKPVDWPQKIPRPTRKRCDPNSVGWSPSMSGKRCDPDSGSPVMSEKAKSTSAPTAKTGADAPPRQSSPLRRAVSCSSSFLACRRLYMRVQKGSVLVPLPGIFETVTVTVHAPSIQVSTSQSIARDRFELNLNGQRASSFKPFRFCT